MIDEPRPLTCIVIIEGVLCAQTRFRERVAHARESRAHLREANRDFEGQDRRASGGGPSSAPCQQRLLWLPPAPTPAPLSTENLRKSHGAPSPRGAFRTAPLTTKAAQAGAITRVVKLRGSQRLVVLDERHQRCGGLRALGA
jgi:hypothetical protein